MKIFFEIAQRVLAVATVLIFALAPVFLSDSNEMSWAMLLCIPHMVVSIFISVYLAQSCRHWSPLKFIACLWFVPGLFSAHPMAVTFDEVMLVFSVISIVLSGLIRLVSKVYNRHF